MYIPKSSEPTYDSVYAEKTRAGYEGQGMGRTRFIEVLR